MALFGCSLDLLNSWQSEAARKKTGAPYAGDGLRATARCRGGREALLTGPALSPHVRKRQTRRCLENRKGNERDLEMGLPIGRTGKTGNGFLRSSLPIDRTGSGPPRLPGQPQALVGASGWRRRMPPASDRTGDVSSSRQSLGDSRTGQRVINRSRVGFSCLRGRPGPKGIRRPDLIVDRAALEFLLLHLQPASSHQGALLSAERPEKRPGSGQPHRGAGDPKGLD